MSTLQESITNLTACKYNLKNFIIYEPKTDKTAKRKKNAITVRNCNMHISIID